MNDNAREHPLRAPCNKCGEASRGYIETRGMQDCVFCFNCSAFLYNAPKVETGRAVRSVSTVHAAIKPNQRARILMRANGHCELCGKHGEALHVGHLLSVESGLKDGLTEVELNSDENLSAMCAECNLGLGKEPVPLRLAIAMVMAHVRREVA